MILRRSHSGHRTGDRRLSGGTSRRRGHNLLFTHGRWVMIKPSSLRSVPGIPSYARKHHCSAFFKNSLADWSLIDCRVVRERSIAPSRLGSKSR